MWRSSYVMCPKCLNVYYASMIQIMPGEKHFHCPNYACSGDALFAIDELMIPAIRSLNRLGYKTAFCCSGHHIMDERPESDRYGYICFKGKYDFKTLPEGWYLDTKSIPVKLIDTRTCIRSGCDILAESIENLEKWLDGLPPHYVVKSEKGEMNGSEQR